MKLPQLKNINKPFTMSYLPNVLYHKITFGMSVFMIHRIWFLFSLSQKDLHNKIYTSDADFRTVLLLPWKKWRPKWPSNTFISTKSSKKTVLPLLVEDLKSRYLRWLSIPQGMYSRSFGFAEGNSSGKIATTTTLDIRGGTSDTHTIVL